MFSRSTRRCLCSAVVAAALTGQAQGQDIQIQNDNGRLVTGVGDVNESTVETLEITIGERVFSQILGPNFLGLNPGFNSEPVTSGLLPEGIGDLGEDTDVFLEFSPTTLYGLESSVFFWDGTDINQDGQLMLDDIRPVMLDNDRSFAVQDSTGAAFFYDDSLASEVQQAGFIQTTSVGGQVGAEFEVGGRLHQHLFFVALANGSLTPNQEAGLFVVSLQVQAEGFESTDPFFVVLQSTLPPETPGGLPITQFGEQAGLLTTFIQESVIDSLDGDFNDNGVVNAADFTVLRDRAASFDGVNGFERFAANFGAEASQAGAAVTSLAVPEPATGFGLAWIVGVAMTRRRR